MFCHTFATNREEEDDEEDDEEDEEEDVDGVGDRPRACNFCSNSL